MKPTTIGKALAVAGLFGAIGAAPLMAQAHAGHDHPHDAPRAGMMMHQMMEHCPMAGGGMMGPHHVLEHAEELGLTDEQAAQLDALREREEELRREVAESMQTLHEILTPEQREALHERMGAEQGRMMHGSGHMEGMQGMPHMGGGMMHGMMRGGHGPSGEPMGPGACPMRGHMMGGAREGHLHPRP